VTNRGSYSGLIGLPSQGLYDKDDHLVATIRAKTPRDAHKLFRKHGLKGILVKTIGR
jgi:hypothetical protein